jgi:hypothetical protein
MDSANQAINPLQDCASLVLNRAKELNAFIARGVASNWQAPEPLADFDAARADSLLPFVMGAIRWANRQSPTVDIRAACPPSSELVRTVLREAGEHIRSVFMLHNGDVLAHVREDDESTGRVVRIGAEGISVTSGIDCLGRSPCRRYFALARGSTVEVRDGWEGLVANVFPLANGIEDAPQDVVLTPFSKRPSLECLIPFPDGGRVLMVSDRGTFVLAESGVTRLMPDAHALADHQNEFPDLEFVLDMAHVALSKDGRWIAAGSQFSPHLIFNERLERVAEIDPWDEYAHYAFFSAGGEVLAFNSCHFYQGKTLALRMRQIDGENAGQEGQFGHGFALQEGCRVYAAAARGDQFILGNAEGYLHCVDIAGKYRWRHYIGTTITSIDVSEDEKSLVASTVGGILAIIDLDTGRKRDFDIGDGAHSERRRWLFLKTEGSPLAW